MALSLIHIFDIDNDADWQAYVDGMYSLGLEDWVATQGIEEIAK